jgi:hypothetical protein
MPSWNVQKDRGYVLLIGVVGRPLSDMADVDVGSDRMMDSRRPMGVKSLAMSGAKGEHWVLVGSQAARSPLMLRYPCLGRGWRAAQVPR